MPGDRLPNIRLRQERLLRRWTHAQLAEQLDISDPHTISRWERGIAVPNALSRQRLCELFGKSAEELGFAPPVAIPAEQTGASEVQDDHPAQAPERTEIASQPPEADEHSSLLEDQKLERSAQDSDSLPLRDEKQQKNRRRLLEKVYAFWIHGLLEHSLQRRSLIPLRLENQIDALGGSSHLAFPRLQQQARPLPEGIRIRDVYGLAAGELLILGQPGSGKTTLLLELARDLLAKALVQDDAPIPVILHLSSWATRQQSLAQWIVHELYHTYQVPRKIGRFWVEEGKLLLLLDGLDEVHASIRSACIQAINLFHQRHNLIPLVVCCRSQPYLEQAQRLDLSMAVMTRPLTPLQMEAYLAATHNHLEGLRVAMQQDERLQQLARSPLMLSMLALTYEGRSVEEILNDRDMASIGQVFKHYTEHMYQSYQRFASTKRYSQQQIEDGLIWLATQLEAHQQNEFYLERMQVDWLPQARLRRLHRGLITRIVGGTVIGYNSWQSFWRGDWHNVFAPASLLYGLISILLFCCLGEWLFDLTTEVRPRWVRTPASKKHTIPKTMLIEWLTGDLFLRADMELRASRHRSWVPVTLKRTFAQFLRGSLVGFLLLVIAYTLLNTLLLRHRLAPLVAIGPALLDGLFFGIVGAQVGRLRVEIKPAESLRWSWHVLSLNWIRALGYGLLFGGGLGLILGLTHVMTVPYPFLPRLLSGLLAGIIPGCVAGMIYLLLRGLSPETVDVTKLVHPNEGIHRSLRRGLLSGLMTTVLVSTVITVVQILLRHVALTDDAGLTAALLFGGGYGSLAGLIVSLLGGLAYLEQALLRLLLAITHNLPYRSLPFLDACVEQILLRKIGGGYIFIHRLLLEYYLGLSKKKPQEEIW